MVPLRDSVGIAFLRSCFSPACHMHGGKSALLGTAAIGLKTPVLCMVRSGASVESGTGIMNLPVLAPFRFSEKASVEADRTVGIRRNSNG
jgi:hypothetical protein